MTARITRLAGAILLEQENQYFLIGNTKQPCNWQQEGFETPDEIDAVKQPFLLLTPVRTIAIEGQHLTVDQSNGATELAQALATRFLIRRNGSVSDRLWRIVTGENDETGASAEQQINITWLIDMPERIWEIVRDAALKCL
jgi:hypothetical protein